MGIKAKKVLKMSTRQEVLLSSELKKRTTLSQYKERIAIILRSDGSESQVAISQCKILFKNYPIFQMPI